MVPIVALSTPKSLYMTSFTFIELGVMYIHHWAKGAVEWAADEGCRHFTAFEKSRSCMREG